MVTQEKRPSQVSTPKVWDKVTSQAEIDDYFHIPYTPVMQVVEKEKLSDGRVWLKVKPMSSSYIEEWILEPELAVEPSHQVEKAVAQPNGFAGDSVSTLLRPTQSALREFDSGRHHGQQDAAERLHPMYTEASCQYSAGYLEGYNSILNPKQPETVASPLSWSVTYNAEWDWYIVWVGDRAVDRAMNYSEAEQIAQKFIAANKFWQEHRERVLAGYAG